MKKYLLIIIFHLLLITFCDAQNPLVKQWDKRFGGTAYESFTSLQQTTDGGYILGGWSLSGISGDKTQNAWGGYDYWIVKIDALGNKQWDKNFGGTDEDYLYSLQQTADGGYILGGWSNSGISGDKTQNIWGWYDYWIVKIDSLGTKQWDKDFGGYGSDALFSLQQTGDGGYILGGYSNSSISGDKTQNTYGGWDYWIIKIDSLGNQQWDKDFGGTDIDVLYSLQQTAEGGYILGGYSNSNISGNKTQNTYGGEDYWIIKIDSLGNKQWDKDFGGTYNDELYSINQTVDGGYILGGWSDSGISGDKTQAIWGPHDYWIIKIDSWGNKQWDKDFGGTDNEEFFSIQQTTEEGYLISGDSYSSISGNKTESNLGAEQTWVIKTDSMGNLQWDKTILTPGHDETGLAIQTKDGCYAIANISDGGVGGYKTQNSWGSHDYWIVKFCDTTLQVPTISLASSDTTMCEKQCINFFDLSQNTPTSWQWYFPGASPDTSTQQNPTNICYNLYGNYNVTLVACNATGCDSVFFPAFINVLPTPPAPVITVSNDTLFASGPYSFAWYEVSNPAVIIGTDSFFVFTPPGSYYVIATDSNGCAVVSNVVNTGVESLSSEPFTITPNPASDELTITYAQYDKAAISIMNTLGETLLVSEITTSKTKLNISSLSNGIYFLQINSGAQHFNRKFVVQR